MEETMPSPHGSGEGLSSPSTLECSPGSQPPSPGPAISLAPPDLDPEAVRGALQEFLQELQSAQREWDKLRTQTSALNCQLAEMEAERDSATSRARQLQKAVAERTCCSWEGSWPGRHELSRRWAWD
ncbi:rootletin-like [Symphalangus syndactylus]|uniref:rootletin-like n=1 Tax=Symphalangus syndactylus TaxID=9590 RepID=UPI003006ED1A